MDINEKISKIEQTVEDLKNLVMALVPKPQIVIEPPKKPESNEFQELLNLLNSDKWPEAVAPELICDISSEQDKEDRAEGILELIIDIHLEGLKLLDFGCGEGYVINRSKNQKPRMAVGYDVKHSEKWNNWEQSHNTLFTTDWADVKSSGPYNVILLYDVLDHMDYNQEILITKLKEIKAVLAPNGKIYMRNHPWCSRHGTHLYNKLNKAFLHLVFTNEELESMGLVQEKVKKFKLPLFDYSNLFNSAGLRIHNGPHQSKKAVEPFFATTPIVAERIKNHYKTLNRQDYKNGKFPIAPLENEFIDYILM